MKHEENLQEFYDRICSRQVPVIQTGRPHINVFTRDSCQHRGSLSRRDYYKVTLILGQGSVEYADRVYRIDRPALLFSTPLAPYAWIPGAGPQDGWFAIFNAELLRQKDSGLADVPFFQANGERLFFLTERQVEHLSMLFSRMMEEKESAYPNKDAILRSYLQLITHEALKMEPATGSSGERGAATRITQLFQELLERQFPVDTQNGVLRLRTAKDFADRLNIHVNHLNRSVKGVTGKTTTEHISSRIVLEADSLLSYTDWTVAEIGYCLGFDYPPHFNHFYKKHTGRSPKSAKQII